MNRNIKILILGAGGLVGSALAREFRRAGYGNLLTPFRKDLDLLVQSEVSRYFQKQKPAIVINAAAKVGGILANNTYRADFLYENLTIQNNALISSFNNNVEKFLFLGSSCIYPKSCQQPIKEEYLLTAPLEETNEPYAIAKIAGLKLTENFRRQFGVNYFSVMPTNLYGENDNFHPENSHVIPGLIMRMSKAIKDGDLVFEAWGSGRPMREFLYVDDLARACRFLIETDKELPYWINVGTGKDITIRELVETIAKILGYKNKIIFNTEKPDGTQRKVLDTSKIQQLGWKAEISLEEGLKKTIDYFKKSPNLRM